MKTPHCPTNLPTGIQLLFPEAGNATQRTTPPTYSVMPRPYTLPPVVGAVMPKAYAMTPSQVAQAIQDAKKDLPLPSLAEQIAGQVVTTAIQETKKAMAFPFLVAKTIQNAKKALPSLDDLQEELYPAVSFVGNTTLSAVLITSAINAVVNPLNVTLAIMAENAAKVAESAVPSSKPVTFNRATLALFYAGYIPSVLGGLKRSSYSLTVKKHLTESSQPKEVESILLDTKTATVLSHESELMTEKETPTTNPIRSYEHMRAMGNIGVLGGSAWFESKLTHQSETESIFAQNAAANQERYGALKSIRWTPANCTIAKSTMPLRTTMSMVNLGFMTIFQEQLTDMFFTPEMRKDYPKTTSSTGGAVSGMFAALINYPLRNMFSDIMRSATLDKKGDLIFDENIETACKRYQSDFFKAISTEGACKSLVKAHQSRIAVRVASSAPVFAIVAGMLAMLGPKPIEDTVEYVSGETSKKAEQTPEEQSSMTHFKP